MKERSIVKLYKRNLDACNTYISIVNTIKVFVNNDNLTEDELSTLKNYAYSAEKRIMSKNVKA